MVRSSSRLSQTAQRTVRVSRIGVGGGCGGNGLQGKITLSAPRRRPSSFAFANTFGCLPAGMRPADFQLDTVVIGSPRAIAIRLTPPKWSKSDWRLDMPQTYETFVFRATIKSYPHGPTFSYSYGCVGTINEQLRALRIEAGMSQKAVAKGLGYEAPTTYIAKEDPKKFKGPHIPVSFAKKLATLYADKGIDPARVMALTGLSSPAFNTIQPDGSVIVLPVQLPNEAVLTKMFETMLEVADKAPRDQRAAALAELLPDSLSSAAASRPAKGQRPAAPKALSPSRAAPNI